MNNPAFPSQVETAPDSLIAFVEDQDKIGRSRCDTRDRPYGAGVSASQASHFEPVTGAEGCDSAGFTKKRAFLVDIADAEFLRACLHYDPLTGRLTWKPRPTSHFMTDGSAKSWNTRFAGKPAFTRSHEGIKAYRGCVTVNGKAHHLEADRVAWALHYGRPPQDLLRCRNGDHTDIRIANLEAVSAHDVQIAIPRKSRFLAGAYLDRDGKWYSSIRIGGRQKRLGTFGSEAEANAAWLAARAEREATLVAAKSPEVFT